MLRNSLIGLRMVTDFKQTAQFGNLLLHSHLSKTFELLFDAFCSSLLMSCTMSFTERDFSH